MTFLDKKTDTTLNKKYCNLKLVFYIKSMCNKD